MRAQLWPLADDDRVEMRDAKAPFVKQLARVLEEEQARRALPFRIGVRKMCADVAETGSSQQRVAQRVAQDVAIGMSDRAFVKWHFDPAENQFSSLCQPVQVVSDSRACHFVRRSCS